LRVMCSHATDTGSTGSARGTPMIRSHSSSLAPFIFPRIASNAVEDDAAVGKLVVKGGVEGTIRLGVRLAIVVALDFGLGLKIESRFSSPVRGFSSSFLRANNASRSTNDPQHRIVVESGLDGPLHQLVQPPKRGRGTNNFLSFLPHVQHDALSSPLYLDTELLERIACLHEASEEG
jgi:hypothetical protein